MPNRICFTSIDVEHDFGEEKSFQGAESLNRILDVFKRNNVPATLFITGEVLEKHSNLVKDWLRFYEIACHGFSHRFWNSLNFEERNKELENFTSLYQRIFNKKPIGFRAPSHIIDEEGMKILEEKGFLYDSSVVPHYPFLKKYRGYKKKAPLTSYHPNIKDIRKKGKMSILEIPVSGQFAGIPLAGAWIGRLPFWVYEILFKVNSPSFLTLNMHSWDILDFPKRKNSSEQFLRNLEGIFRLLKSKKYKFLNGEQILKNQ
ncbi:MAG: polysaccharide deacetylase family protein [Candidatus Nealsonbacteria bacterium]